MEIKESHELMRMSSLELQSEFETTYQEIDRLDKEVETVEMARYAHLQSLIAQLDPYDSQIDEIIKGQEKVRDYAGLISMTLYRKSQIMHGELQNLIVRFLSGETITEDEAKEWQSRWTDEGE